MDPRRLLAIATGTLLAATYVACSSTDDAASKASAATTGATGTTTTATGSGGAGGSGGGPGGSGGVTAEDAGAPDAAPDAAAIDTTICDAMGLAPRPFAAGPYGPHRGDLADDFTIDLADGSTYAFQQGFTGCELHVFVPDTLVVSDQDATSIWEADLDKLLKASPKNVHYVFISRQKTDAAAKKSTDAMVARVDALLAKLAKGDADHWRARVHVAAPRAGALGNWVGDVISGSGRIGFVIDRDQRVRGMGMLADVKRYDQALADAKAWPWKSNLAYAANEAVYWNAQADQQAKLDADGATIVPVFEGETLAEFAEKDVALPSAAELAKFDTLEVEVTSACPNPDEIEFGNCGAWDYIASLGVFDANQKNVEVARFITSYHRETHWVVDASAMLVQLASGGTRHFRWDFAPSWNTQPTATKLALRFSNRKKAVRPSAATFLWSGGGFGAAYNDAHPPVTVDIPAGAKKVELFAIITGHGAGTGQCSEFCNHQHEFTVNGTVHLKDHKVAGSSDKCMPEMKHGMVPNQGGTWWFGRGGWCPGEQVDPWVVDVTSAVTPGQAATIAYRGLVVGKPPADGSGDIDMVSYLVVHE